MGWRALAPCVTSPHPETDRLEAKLVVKTGIEVLRQKSKVKAKGAADPAAARVEQRGDARGPGTAKGAADPAASLVEQDGNRQGPRHRTVSVEHVSLKH